MLRLEAPVPADWQVELPKTQVARARGHPDQPVEDSVLLPAPLGPEATSVLVGYLSETISVSEAVQRASARSARLFADLLNVAEALGLEALATAMADALADGVSLPEGPGAARR